MAVDFLGQDYNEATGNRLSSVSILRMFPIMVDDDDTQFMNIFRSYTVYDDTIKDTLYFQTYEAENEDWWDMISYKMYGSSNLWWMICTSNNVNNPFEDLEAGTNLKILHERFLAQLIREIRDISEL